jgi:hypothetical protein
MTRRTTLQQLATDLKQHLLDIEDHASQLKMRIFDFEKQITGVAADKEPVTNLALGRAATWNSKSFS